MILALLTQVQIWPSLPDLSPTGDVGWQIYYHADLANSTSALDEQLLAVFVLRVHLWGQTFSISSKTIAHNQQQPVILHIIVCSKTNSSTS